MVNERASLASMDLLLDLAPETPEAVESVNTLGQLGPHAGSDMQFMPCGQLPIKAWHREHLAAPGTT